MWTRTLAMTWLAAAALAGAASADEGGEQEKLALREDDRRAPAPPSFSDAVPRAFVEGGASVFNFTAESAGSQIGGTLRAGLAFNDLFAVEVDYSVLENAEAVVIGTIPDPTGPGEIIALREPDQVSTAFARAVWPLNDRLSAHARLGFARLDSENEAGDDESASGAAFGAGASLRIAGPTALRADYTRMQLDDLEADVGTIAFSVAF
jgi:hypothetical protein